MAEEANSQGQEQAQGQQQQTQGQEQGQQSQQQGQSQQGQQQQKETVLTQKDSTTTEGKQGAPEKYELKLPENSFLDASHMDEISSYAKEKGLSNEQAQALLDARNQSVAEVVERQSNQWLKETQADKEIGGDNLKQSVEHAKRAINRFGSDAFKSVLNKYGYGNHPEVVRAWAAVGRAMADGTLVVAGNQTTQKKEKSIGDVFYPDTKSA